MTDTVIASEFYRFVLFLTAADHVSLIGEIYGDWRSGLPGLHTYPWHAYFACNILEPKFGHMLFCQLILTWTARHFIYHLLPTGCRCLALPLYDTMDKNVASWHLSHFISCIQPTVSRRVSRKWRSIKSDVGGRSEV